MSRCCSIPLNYWENCVAPCTLIYTKTARAQAHPACKSGWLPSNNRNSGGQRDAVVADPAGIGDRLDAQPARPVKGLRIGRLDLAGLIEPWRRRDLGRKQ